MPTPTDLDQLQLQGQSEQKVSLQLECFKKGFPFLEIVSSTDVNNGLLSLGEDQVEAYLGIWEKYLQESKHVLKFVPASGAASRMFKDLFEFLEQPGSQPFSPFIEHFFAHIKLFAFYEDLDNCCKEKTGRSIEELISAQEHATIIRLLLTEEGLNYGNLPKGLLKFHLYKNGSRTPFEEHLVEGAVYAGGKSGYVNLHFTVSPEHRSKFEDLAEKVIPNYQTIYGVKYMVTFSEQKPSTDTIAADENNAPFRNSDGKLLFRPGGHGALIENLNDLNEPDVIFIKNIDNVVPDKIKSSTITYKKVIAGVLINLQKSIFDYLRILDKGTYNAEKLREIIRFMQDELFIRNPEIKLLDDSELALYLKQKLNRPIRICGMVRNEGEPGGGPFMCVNKDRTISAQILESSQIDMKDPESKRRFEEGNFFNPVDLVCAVKDYKGNKFDLTQYVDPDTGFISEKSKDGKKLKALELPGLWNGAMSDWITVFVEVPIETFNPVKTVNDLLRPQHQ